jgi:hypothetical protein
MILSPNQEEPSTPYTHHHVTIQQIQLGCGVAQIVARRLAVRQARVRIWLGTPEETLYRAESNEDNKSDALRVVYIKNIVCPLD